MILLYILYVIMQMIVAVELRQWSGVEAYIYSCIVEYLNI